MQQIIGMLARMDANMKSMLEKIDASQVKADTNTAEIKEMREEMNSSHKEILAKMEANGKAHLEAMKRMMEKMMDVNQAAHLEGEELTSVDIEPEVAHQEVRRDASQRTEEMA
jgi:hypothetical protein